MGESGKLTFLRVARSPVEAHLQLVFGIQVNGKQSRKTLNFWWFLYRRWRWNMSTRSSRAGMQEASAQCKLARLRRARRSETGQAGNPAGSGGSNGASQCFRKPGSAMGSVSARQLCMAAGTGDCGLRDNAAGQDRKPDAGASAGDETQHTPVARPGEQGQTSGAKCALTQMRWKVCRIPRQSRSSHALVRVGSTAMSAPFALGADHLVAPTIGFLARPPAICPSRAIY